MLSVAVVFFSDRWTAEVARRLGVTERVALVAVILIVAALPVLARQVIEPLNMERVEVKRQGQPTLTADLVAVRDSSIAEKLGIFSPHPIKPQSTPC